MLSFFKSRTWKRENKKFVKNHCLNACFQDLTEKFNDLEYKFKNFQKKLESFDKLFQDTLINFEGDILKRVEEIRIQGLSTKEHLEDVEKKVLYKKRFIANGRRRH